MDTPTLGQYFRRLRQERKPWADLDRATLERMTREELRAEAGKRRWGAPGGGYRGTAAEAAWVRHFLKRQTEQRPVTLQWVADRAGLDKGAIWKIEHDRPVLGETLRGALVDGLGLGPGSDEVRHALALWTVAASGGKMGPEAGKTSRLAQEIGAVQQSDSFNQFLQRAIPMLAGLAATEYDDVLAALSNPAVVAALPALNGVAAAKREPKLRVIQGGRGRKK